MRRKIELNGQPSSRSRRFAAPRGRRRCRPTIEWFALRPQAYAPGLSDGGALSLRAKLAPGATQTSRDWQSPLVRSVIRPGKAGGRSRRSTARRLADMRHVAGARSLALSHAIERTWNAELRHQQSASSSAQLARSASGIVRRRKAACRAIPHFSSTIANNEARPRPAPHRP